MISNSCKRRKCDNLSLSYHMFQSLLDNVGQRIGKTWIQANCMCSFCYSLQKCPIKNPVSAELHHVGVFRFEWVSTLSTHMTALWVLKYWNCFISCVSHLGAAVKTVPNPNKEGKSDLRRLRTCSLYCTVHIGLNITLLSFYLYSELHSSVWLVVRRQLPRYSWVIFLFLQLLLLSEPLTVVCSHYLWQTRRKTWPCMLLSITCSSPLKTHFTA